MKLNVGSSYPRGQYRRDDWVNLDLVPAGSPNVVASAYEMPFLDDTFDLIHCVHVLEHVARDKWPLMLAEMFRVLEPGGFCFVEVPDFPGQCRAYLKGLIRDTQQTHIHRTGIWGKSERPGMGHQFGFDEDLLFRAFRKIGFRAPALLTSPEEMISGHYRDVPVILIKATKSDYRPPKNVADMSFDDLRSFILI